MENAREISGFNPPQETGQYIMNMDTNEITINRIVGFQCDEPGTDVEDELPKTDRITGSERRPCDPSDGDSRFTQPGRRF